MRKTLSMLLVIAALIAARCLAWAEAPDAPSTRRLTPGALVSLDLSAGAQTFEILPEGDVACEVCAFPGEGFSGRVTARLYQDGEKVNEGAGSLTLFKQEFASGGRYTLQVSGEGRIWLELARSALSRCFDDPKPLDAAGDSYEKAIVKPGDAHWYALTAQQRQPIVLSGLPEADHLKLEARLFSESGRLLAEATRTAGGAFLMDFMPRPGRAYRVRVSAAGDGVGLYALNVAPGTGGLPEAILLSEDQVTLYGRERRALEVTAIPEGAAGAMLWESSDERVVGVTQDGALSGRSPGTAVVTAYAAGAVRARCRVEVRRVAATGVELITRSLRLGVGDDVALEWSVLPENASEPGVRFDIRPEGVATVDDAGVLRGVGVGTATLTARTVDGGFMAEGVVRVTPARKRYRALLVGEQSYSPDVAAERPGSANSVAGMRSMLGELSFLGSRYEISTALDISHDALLEAIERAFDGAAETDEALFYITCHGHYAHGMTVFQLYDGTGITAQELRQALDKVPGRITLLLDCCGSGGVTGRAGDILDGVRRAFGPAGPAVFGASRYRVLASAMVDQDSYRMSFDSSASETRVATLFARAVCEGCGWSIDAAARRAMRADINYDNAVTLDELYHYARRRVMWYLSRNGGGLAQTVQVGAIGSDGALFERIEAME